MEFSMEREKDRRRGEKDKHTCGRRCSSASLVKVPIASPTSSCKMSE